MLNPWVLATVANGYRTQFQLCPPPFSGVHMTVIKDPVQAQILSGEIKVLSFGLSVSPIVFTNVVSAAISPPSNVWQCYETFHPIRKVLVSSLSVSEVVGYDFTSSGSGPYRSSQGSQFPK